MRKSTYFKESSSGVHVPRDDDNPAGPAEAPTLKGETRTSSESADSRTSRRQHASQKLRLNPYFLLIDRASQISLNARML
jgi:hypothetical protein